VRNPGSARAADTSDDTRLCIVQAKKPFAGVPRAESSGNGFTESRKDGSDTIIRHEGSTPISGVPPLLAHTV